MKSYITSKNNYFSNPEKFKHIGIFVGVCLLVALGVFTVFKSVNKNNENPSYSSADNSDIKEHIETTPKSLEETESDTPAIELYQVLSVTDGDTFRIDYNGTSTPVRIIGVNTPETVDSRTTVECFGKEASEYLKNKLTGKQVSIEADPTQSNRDKYDRLLRYVYLDGEDVGLSIIADGYGYEYTYDVPYQKQSEYKAAQTSASTNKRGLWSDSTCSGQKTTSEGTTSTPTPTTTPAPTPSNTADCTIKGNISNKGEKIYHVPGQRYYDKTIIDTSKGERYFCTEQEAINAGWRKSKV